MTVWPPELLMLFEIKTAGNINYRQFCFDFRQSNTLLQHYFSNCIARVTYK